MRRSVIIGDVHGCLDELTHLLASLEASAEDRVFFVGDLVARGPDTTGVLALCRRIGARSVRGNHEGRLLAARHALQSGKRRRLSNAHYPLLRRLSDADWDYIEAMPLWIDLPEHDLRIVHAGVLPSRPFEQQDEWTLTHVRSVDADGRASEKTEFAPWAAAYGAGPHIVFGHNSRVGLQVQPNATGIDTGCVYGGRLTALVLAEGQRVPAPDGERRAVLRSVPAQATHYVSRASP
jgi:calcineurin-like phosphoesterase family protein